jgi:hypothetical protein
VWISDRLTEASSRSGMAIDMEEDKAARVVVFGLLAEVERK